MHVVSCCATDVTPADWTTSKIAFFPSKPNNTRRSVWSIHSTYDWQLLVIMTDSVWSIQSVWSIHSTDDWQCLEHTQYWWLTVFGAYTVLGVWLTVFGAYTVLTLVYAVLVTNSVRSIYRVYTYIRKYIQPITYTEVLGLCYYIILRIIR